MHALVIGTLFQLGLTEAGIKLARRWINGPTTLKKHDAATGALNKHAPLHALAYSYRSPRFQRYP